MTIRVAIADDQAIVRAGLVKLLEAERGFSVAGEAADGVEALGLVREAVARHLMDIRMPRLDGLEATKCIGQEAADTRVIMLTTFGLDDMCSTPCATVPAASYEGRRAVVLIAGNPPRRERRLASRAGAMRRRSLSEQSVQSRSRDGHDAREAHVAGA